jgi:hypothetical protein
MKKLLLIIPLAMLVACDPPGDRPTKVQMDCIFWDIHARIYKNRAILDIRQSKRFDPQHPILVETRDVLGNWLGIKETRIVAVRDTDREYDAWGVPHATRLAFVGHEKQTGQETVFQFWYDYESKTKSMFSLDFISDAAIACNIIVPAQTRINPPNGMNRARVSQRKAKRIKYCIDYIYNNAMVEHSWDEPTETLHTIFRIKNNAGRWIAIDQDAALRLSKNWDFNNKKFYNNRSRHVYEHQLDACEVMERLKKFQENI